MQPEDQKKDDLSRFEVSRGTLWVDRAMGWIVNTGGVLIIAAVFGILIYLVTIVGPLFGGAKVEEGATLPLGNPVAKPTLGVSEDGSAAFVYGGGPELRWLKTRGKGVVDSLPLPIPRALEVTAWRWRSYDKQLGIAFSDGSFSLLDVSWSNGDELHVKDAKPVSLNAEGRIVDLGFASGSSEQLVAGVIERPAGKTVKIVSLKEKKGLIGKGTVSVDLEQDLTGELEGKTPARVLVSRSMREIVVELDGGEVLLFGRTGKEFVKRQSFRPFTAEEGALGGMDFLFGDVSVVTTSSTGAQKIFSLMVPEGAKQRELHQTKLLPSLGGPPDAFAISLRNKSYLTATGSKISLRYATTESVRWSGDVGYPIAAAAINAKNDRIFLLGRDGIIHSMVLEDRFPESGWTAFFGKIWYEGQSKPDYAWQSSGSNDDYEPKYSMVPLIFGTFKATLYSMLIAVPIALLAAIYASQFLSPRAKRVIKPAMEIMASLPSVVLGFLAAFWLAPLIQFSIPSLISALIVTPLAVILASHAWNSLPTRVRNRIPKGFEYLFLIPVVLGAAYIGWRLGGPLEAILFKVPNPNGPGVIPDFTLWWTEKKTFLPLGPLLAVVLGFPMMFFLLSGKSSRLEPFLGKLTAPFLGAGCFVACYGLGLLLDNAFPSSFATNQYEQRNATVVGFMMGFAVIPVIFTIAEDALSNVPGHLSAAGFAMGASRWQVMRMVILPTAAAGIFSALMIGFGRAVGETMVVVMAAGNTPIMEWNPFNGMRPLSANLAVELPEAPALSMHFRALHLGALILFVLTFAVNTVAEVVRQHLRNKFKAL